MNLDEIVDQSGENFEMPDTLEDLSVTIKVEEPTEEEPIDNEDMDINVSILESGLSGEDEVEDKINFIYRVISFFNSAQANNELTPLQFKVIREMIQVDSDFSDNRNSFLITGDGSIISNNAFADYINNFAQHNRELVMNVAGKLSKVLTVAKLVLGKVDFDKLDGYRTMSHILATMNQNYMSNDRSIFNGFKLEFDKLAPMVNDDELTTPQFEILTEMVSKLGYGDKTLVDISGLLLVTLETFDENMMTVIDDTIKLCDDIFNTDTITQTDVLKLLTNREKLISIPNDIILLNTAFGEEDIFEMIQLGCVNVF